MLNIEEKIDSEEKLKAIEGKPSKNYFFAAEFNAVVNAVKEALETNINQENSIEDLYTKIPTGLFRSVITPSSTPSGTGEAFWFATQPGTYNNHGGFVVNANSYALFGRDAAGAFSFSQTAFDLSTYAKVDDIKKGGVRDWVSGAYLAGEIVRHKGILWKASVNIGSSEPSVNSAWVAYLPFSKPISITASHSLTFSIDLVANKIKTTGSSTNKLITQNGIFSILAQEINITTPSYFAIIYNTKTLILRTVSVFENNSNSLGVDDYVLGYVNNLNDSIREVYGINAYTLKDSYGTYTYPVKFQEKDLYNENFRWRSTITHDEKVWVSKAIVDVEFYNIKDNQYVTFYGLGRKYGASNLCYLSFIHFDGVGNNQLFSDEFNNQFTQTYDVNLHSGVKTYYLRKGNKTNQNTTIVGKVIIDWDSIKLGDRMVEANSNVLVNSSLVLSIKYVKSLVFNNPFGFVRLANSSSLNAYYDSPTISSYAGIVGDSVPKVEFADCRNWYLKWDELVTNVPDGYTITKQIITNDAPTDTDVSGKLPIYGYSFYPNKLSPGDNSANYTQTLPRVFLNLSIHGHEKIPSFIVYEFFKEMLSNWRSSDFLEYLRFNVEFVIIPCANPHGWNANSGAGSRKNYNNVDLNRNFPSYWLGGGAPSDPTYSGISALSEIESQAIYNFMQSKVNNATVLGVDFHNFHGSAVANNKELSLSWIVSMGDELGSSSANVLIKKLSKKYKEKSALIPQDDDYFIGTINNYIGNGYAGMQLKELGCVYGCTFEVAQNFRFNPFYKSFDSDAMTFGVESFANFLRIFLREFTEEYNRTRCNF